MSTVANPPLIPRIDRRRCTGCAQCEQRCPTQAVAIRDGVAVVVRPDVCSFCEVCERFCPTGAIGRPFVIMFAPSTLTIDLAAPATTGEMSTMLRDSSTTHR